MASKTWEDLDRDLTEKWAKLRLAHQATMVEDARMVLAQARQQTEGHNRIMTENPALPEPDVGGMHIGDVIHQTAPAVAQAAPKLPGWLKWLGVGAVALATGGVGSLLPVAMGWLRERAETATVQPAEKQYEFSVDGGKTWKPIERPNAKTAPNP